MQQAELCPGNELPSLWVKKSNALARSRVPVGDERQTVLELRLIAILASRIRQDAEAFMEYKIHLSELFGRRSYGGKDVAEVKEAVRRLVRRVIEIKGENGSWKMFPIMGVCDFDGPTGILTMVFNERIREHFLNLQKLFTRYSLEEFIKIPCVYSQRLYEFLKSWEQQGEVIWPLAELHEILSASPTHRKDFRQFRKFVLDKGARDLKAIDFEFEWEPLKTGRTIDRIRFTIFGSRKARRSREEARRKLRSEALLCLNSHGRVCGKDNNRPEVCEICNIIRSK